VNEWEAFHDPMDGSVKRDGKNIIEFPKLPEFQQMTLKVHAPRRTSHRREISDAVIDAGQCIANSFTATAAGQGRRSRRR